MFDKIKKRERRRFKTGGMDELLRFKGFTVKPMKEGVAWTNLFVRA